MRVRQATESRPPAVAQEAMRRGYNMPTAARSTAVVISVHTGDTVIRILAVWWKREAICTACRGRKSASLLTACIVFGVADGSQYSATESASQRDPGRMMQIMVLFNLAPELTAIRNSTVFSSFFDWAITQAPGEVRNGSNEKLCRSANLERATSKFRISASAAWG